MPTVTPPLLVLHTEAIDRETLPANAGSDRRRIGTRSLVPSQPAWRLISRRARLLVGFLARMNRV